MKHGSLPNMTRAELAACIDHSALAPTVNASDVARYCEEALREGFAAVCVNSSQTHTAVRELAGSQVAVAVTIGFPLGACSTGTKLYEAREALELGAKELDVVIALGPLLSNEDDRVSDEIRALATLCTAYRGHMKVILETCLLTDMDLIRGVCLACHAGAHFVKTSTGFGSRGATAEHVALLRRHAPKGVKVKASGGIRTLSDARIMLAAGASRLGCSSSMAILDELAGK